MKRIVNAMLILEAFDRDQTITVYTFIIDYYALNYLELIIAFSFDQLTYIFLFIAVGAVTVAATAVYWLFHRIITTLDPPPRFRFMSFFAIVTPAPFIGVTMALGPVMVMLAGVYLLINGDIALHNVPRSALGNVLWLMDQLFGNYTDTFVDPGQVAAVRQGRIGILFISIGLCLMVLGVKTLIPKEVSKRERELRLKGEDGESVWQPTQWKRGTFLFVSLVFAFFMNCVIEFSLWPGFGIYVYYILVALWIVQQVVGIVLDLLLMEALLLAPLDAAFNAIVMTVTVGAADFAAFILAYFVNYAIMILDRIYVGPATAATLGWLKDSIFELIRWARKKIKMRKAMTLEAELAAEEANRLKNKQREVRCWC